MKKSLNDLRAQAKRITKRNDELGGGRVTGIYEQDIYQAMDRARIQRGITIFGDDNEKKELK